MINNCLVLLFCMLVAVPAFSAQHVALHPRSGFDSADQETIRQIVDMERQSKEASLRRDFDFSLRTLADDYVAITPLGQVTTKAETISARRSGQLRYEAINITDMVVRVYGDTAVVTARADVKGHQLGEDFSGPYRYTRVWVRRNGQWQTVSYQATVTQQTCGTLLAPERRAGIVVLTNMEDQPTSDLAREILNILVAAPENKP